MVHLSEELNALDQFLEAQYNHMFSLCDNGEREKARF